MTRDLKRVLHRRTLRHGAIACGHASHFHSRVIRSASATRRNVKLAN